MGVCHIASKGSVLNQRGLLVIGSAAILCLYTFECASAASAPAFNGRAGSSASCATREDSRELGKPEPFAQIFVIYAAYQPDTLVGNEKDLFTIKALHDASSDLCYGGSALSEWNASHEDSRVPPLKDLGVHQPFLDSLSKSQIQAFNLKGFAAGKTGINWRST